jgi:hypothetical protein
VTQREPEHDPLASHRARRRVWPTLGLALGALVLLYCGGWLISGARFSGALDRLRAQGEPILPSEMAPKLKPGERNAADVYQQAFAIAPTAAVRQLQDAANPPWTGHELALAQSIVATNQQYYDLLDDASRLDTCAFPWDWGAVSGAPFIRLGDTLSAGRALWVKAQVQVQAGDLDGALASCAIALRIANHVAATPSPVSFGYARVIRFTALGGVSSILSAGDPSPAACRELAGRLASVDHRALLTRSLRADRAWGLVVLRWMESGEWFLQARRQSVRGAVRAAYPVVAKPLWNADKEQYLQLMAAYLEAAQRPWPEAAKEVVRLDRELKRFSRDPSGGMVMVALPQAADFATAGQDAAMTGAWQIALALKAYHHDHHAYPASLVELEKETWKLPRDPFTQQPYHYRRTGAGFAIWSVGFDAKDNGGHQFIGPSAEALKPGTDFVLDLPR